MDLNVKTFSGALVAVVIAALMVVTLAVPMLSEGTSETKTAINEGMRASLYQPGDTHTILMDANGIKTDDGDYQPYPDRSRYGEATLFISSGPNEDNRGAIVRYSADGNVRLYLYLGADYVGRAISDPITNPITVTINEEGTATLTPTEGIERSISNIQVYPDAAGDYALTYDPEITAGSVIYGGGNTTVSSVVYGLRFEGNYDNLSATLIAPISSEITSYDVNVVRLTTDLYRLNFVHMVADEEVDLTYSYVFAPYEVTYANPGYTPSTASIISIIPILILAGLVIGVVGSFIRNRD